jgi:hypothetical protein
MLNFRAFPLGKEKEEVEGLSEGARGSVHAIERVR